MKIPSDKFILGLIVLTAIMVRVFTIWIGRPEFVGWFNHTYYYYVEVKGLLESGKLPFPDMPLLFYLYAFTAKIFSAFGMGFNTAVVNATRFWMSIIPSLIAIPVYFTIKEIYHKKELNKQAWGIILVSAFLPLSVLHIPEFSQKNALGLLLFATLLFFAKKTMQTYNLKNIIALCLLAILITLTHFGSSGAMILFGFSVLIVFLITQKNIKSILRYGLVLTTGLAMIMALIYLFDDQRFYRIFFYSKSSFHTSLLNVLFTSDTSLSDKLLSIVSIAAPLLVAFWMYRIFLKFEKELKNADKMFFLSCLLFCYLLVLPVYDQLLLARLALFISLPFLLVIAYLLKYASFKNWVKNGLVLVLVFGSFLLVFGEIMSLKMHDRNKMEVYSALMEMKKQVAFKENDLIITKNGAEHICNWFLGTKSAVITAFNLNDFNNYNRIFIMNPIQGILNFNDIQNKNASNEADRYLFMMRNIPQPQNSTLLYNSEHVELYQLDSAPKEWEYDDEGFWYSYEK